jgi:signal transduction histidine kinase
VATGAVQLEAIETFADLLFAVDSDDGSGAFYDRLCEAACRVADMDRGAVFLYDEALRRVRVVGSHGIAIEAFRDVHVQLDDAPMALRALSEDRVVEAVDDFADELPAPFLHLLDDTRLVCTPIAAGGHWPGVVLTDRARDRPLSDGERHALWSLGKIAALAASARVATRELEHARQLQERIDLAREIHDGVVQRLFGVSLALAADQVGDEERRRCVAELHASLADLRSALQRPLGRPSPETQTTVVEVVRHLARAHPELRVELRADAAVEVPARVEPLAQSVLSEALRNARKHAAPERVCVHLGRRDGAFVLEVHNDGVPAQARAAKAGVGLRLAAVEALQHGGVVEFGPAEPGAWRVRLLVPEEGA